MTGGSRYEPDWKKELVELSDRYAAERTRYQAMMHVYAESVQAGDPPAHLARQYARLRAEHARVTATYDQLSAYRRELAARRDAALRRSGELLR